MGSLPRSLLQKHTPIIAMGNAAARQRLKFKDFAYIAKNANFASRGIVEDYYNELIAKCPIGKMDLEQFKVTFRLAFPERPEEKLLLLTEKVANVDKTDGMIPLHCMGMLLYLFCDGKTEVNLLGIFNLFDKDDKLTKAEFVAGMTGHPVIAKILAHKTIDALL